MQRTIKGLVQEATFVSVQATLSRIEGPLTPKLSPIPTGDKAKQVHENPGLSHGIFSLTD